VEASTRDHARERLETIDEVLDAAGARREAWQARRLAAEGLPLGDQPGAFRRLASAAERQQAGARAGRAYLRAAQALRTLGVPREEVDAMLDRAEKAYVESDHVHGPLDVACERIDLGIAYDEPAVAQFESIREAYRAQKNAHGELLVLQRTSQAAHVAGRTADAARLMEEMESVARDAGMGLVLDSVYLSLLDVLMRRQQFGGATELAEAAIAAAQTRMVKALYRQLLSTLYVQAGRTADSLDQAEAAINTFTELGADDAASDAVHHVAEALFASGEPGAEERAFRLLQRQIESDLDRDDVAGALWHAEHKAQLHVRRVVTARGSGAPEDAARPEDVAREDAEAAEALGVFIESHLDEISGVDHARRAGALWQLRGQIATIRNDLGEVKRCFQTARDVYDEAGLHVEAANSLYILGTLALNATNRELMPHFETAERSLQRAHSAYEEMQMPERVADASYMLAQLYVNAAARLDEHAQTLTDAALQHLERATVAYDTIRREYTTGTSAERQQAKRFVAQGRHRAHDLTLQIVAQFRLDSEQTWAQVQRMKARALSDSLGLSEVSLDALIPDDPAARRLVEEEQALSTRLSQSDPADRVQLRAEQAKLLQRMREHEGLRSYVQMRLGEPILDDELETLAKSRIPDAARTVAADWFVLRKEFWVVVRRFGGGRTVALEPTGVTVTDVRRFLRDNVEGERYRDTYRDFYYDLRPLDALVAPLVHHTQPGDLLVLVPTGDLHRLPLHALHLDGAPVLVRHPVVYSPSLTVLGHCLSRAAAPSLRSAALLVDPSGDRPSARDLGRTLRERLSALAAVTLDAGDAVTRERVEATIRDVDLMHFHGHAHFNGKEPLSSALELSPAAPPSRLTAADVFGLDGMQAALVTLGACESGTSHIEPGDEPLGLIPAFLTSGAQSVVASMWSVAAAPTRAFLEQFYDGVTAGIAPGNDGDRA
jgi:tetratricopeptide (TPR) repeat protein